jgi:hypothetical protein
MYGLEKLLGVSYERFEQDISELFSEIESNGRLKDGDTHKRPFGKLLMCF